MAEEINLEKCNFRNFRSPVTLTLRSDRVIWHTSCISHRPLSTYQFSLKSEKLFVDRRTDVRTDVPTDGHFRPPLMLLGRLRGVDLKSHGMIKCTRLPGNRKNGNRDKMSSQFAHDQQSVSRWWCQSANICLHYSSLIFVDIKFKIIVT